MESLCLQVQSQPVPGPRQNLTEAGDFLASLEGEGFGWLGHIHEYLAQFLYSHSSSVVWISDLLSGPVRPILQRGTTVIHIFSHGQVALL